MMAALTHAGSALLVAVLVGLVVRGRLTRLSTWTAYCAVLLAWQLALAAHPALFTWRNYAVKDLVATGLVLALVLEVGLKVFGRLPRLRRRFGLCTLAVLGLTIAYTASVPVPDPGVGWAKHVVLEALPRANAGITLLYAATLLQVVLPASGIPLDLAHKSVLSSMSAYLCLYFLAADQLGVLGEVARAAADVAVAVSFVALALHWTLVAWRPQEVFSVFPSVEQRFWPWAPASSPRSS